MIKAYPQTYCIIKIEDLDNIDFSQVFQTSAQTIRKSLDGNFFVIKYNDEPTFIKDGTVMPNQFLTHAEAVLLMSTIFWSEPIEEEEVKR